ncbi:MAG: type II secretion system protein GspE [Candidatus Auribacter fodinae]|jgi:type IV pilus assembly protein PilB|uniref:protein-secreting ATPase n=1 Tax=Candidatus Auribacter fodinae TaxID=2093366 RepID=A0A3A4QZY7_9BACT|nr:MAG: type II secretion system protein GspE [Candidatus Auribacter fodinae]
MNFSQDQIVGQLLFERGVISEEQLLEALEEKQRSGKLLSYILVDFGFVTEHDLLQTIGQQLNMDVVDLNQLDIAQSVINKINPTMARMYQVVPVDFFDNVLTIAMADPLNPNILDELRFIVDCDVKGAISNAKDIEKALEKYYGMEESEESISNLIDSYDDFDLDMDLLDDDRSDITNLTEMVNEAPVIKLLNLVLLQAIKDKASDIHFEPFETDFKIRYRVDGTLYEMIPPPRHLALAVTSRIKVLANLNVAERRLPQDGRIQLNVGGKNIDLRVSTLPTAFGESVVMRVLDRSNVSLDLENIGLSDKILSFIGEIIEKPNGIFIVTGPTGSGKTTTLYSCLRRVNSIDSKIITTEDPIEYDLDGIVQVAIRDSVGLTFSRCLRAILRQDPDRVMVGEIRDLDTAQIAIEASLTGHFVFSTLHTNDAPSSITRLMDMGIEPFLLTSSLEGVLAQRLVRTICKECKTPYEPTREILATAGLTMEDVEGHKLYYGKGCKTCNNTGYKGRTGIYELLIINDAIREMILESAPQSALMAKAREMGMQTLRENGFEKAFLGQTTLEEVLREA